MLVATVAEIGDDSPLPFLLTELKEGPTAYGRFLAAESLHKRGRSEGFDAMIAEWQGKRPKTKPQAGKRNNESEDPEAGLTSVAGFLASCGKVEGITTLEEDLRKRSLHLRMHVVSSFGEARNMSVIGSGGGGKLDPSESKGRDKSRDVSVAIEKLLISELDDTEERTGMSGTWDGKHFADPRICDVAANVLNQRAPDKYSFDLSAPLVNRDRAIIELKNAWRKEQKLPPLPVPTPKKIAQVPEERLGPLVDRLLAATEADRQKTEAEITDAGLGALPGIQRHLQKTTKKEQRVLLEGLARRLACTVEEAFVAEGSVKADKALIEKLKGMKGKPFDPDSFLELMRLPAKNLPKGAHAIRFAVDRTGDGTGISVRVYLLDEAHANQLGRTGYITPADDAPKDIPSGWNFNERVNVGRKCLHSATGACTYAHWLDDKHEDLRSSLEAACSAAPSEPIDVRVQLIADWPK